MSTITIRIPDRTEAKLQQMAKAAGKSLEQLVGNFLEAQASGKKMLQEISGGVQKRFMESGMTEEELAERLEREDHQARGVDYHRYGAISVCSGTDNSVPIWNIRCNVFGAILKPKRWVSAHCDLLADSLI